MGSTKEWVEPGTIDKINDEVKHILEELKDKGGTRRFYYWSEDPKEWGDFELYNLLESQGHLDSKFIDNSCLVVEFWKKREAFTGRS